MVQLRYQAQLRRVLADEYVAKTSHVHDEWVSEWVLEYRTLYQEKN